MACFWKLPGSNLGRLTEYKVKAISVLASGSQEVEFPNFKTVGT